ncbi:MAG: formylglycine-generating enzyme family protein [Pirellulales bacterium]
MTSVRSPSRAGQAVDRIQFRLVVATFFYLCALAPISSRAADVDPLKNPDAEAKTEAEMKPYSELIPNTEVGFDMLPIKGGKFTIGSPSDEEGRNEDEGPQKEVAVAPFWMGKHEVTWDEYEIFMFALDHQRRQVLKIDPSANDKLADAIAHPTKPYTDMTFGMGKKGFPAISMTHYAARMYCKWLSMKTGRYYRLPTEAEWEYACRAGTTTAYSFGDDQSELAKHALFYHDGETEKYNKVGKLKPNPWGLYDMHGNVNEWVLDQYVADRYNRLTAGQSALPVATTKLYPHVARGGAWDDDPPALRSAVRRASDIEWKQQDPQLPQSVWYHTDAQFSGFRLLRPLVEPSEEEKQKIWDTGLEIEGEGGRVVFPGSENQAPASGN